MSVAVAFLVAACSGSDDPSSLDDTSPEPPPRIGVAGDAADGAVAGPVDDAPEATAPDGADESAVEASAPPTTASDFVVNRSAEACEVERQTLEVAIEAHFALEGVDASSMQELVDDQFLRELPEHWLLLVGPDGVATPVPVVGGRCDA